MQTNDESMILAKPSGITLKQHSDDVINEGLAICQLLKSTCEKYKLIVDKDLSRRLYYAARFHDRGKTNSIWQKACREDFEKNCGEGICLRKSGVRHEMYSLECISKECKNIPLPIMVAIAAHHGKLGFSYENKWKRSRVAKSFWRQFQEESSETTENGDLQVICTKLFEYDAVRGLLRLADHRASAGEENPGTVPPLIAFDYKFPFKQKRGIQRLVEQNWDNDILLVRAPTGAGKTDASLLWASHQINAHKADRLVFAMPTRFTANALSINVSETLSDTGIYHSSAWYSKYSEVKRGGKQLSEALAQHKMARVLATPITVCTVDHLLMSLTQTREDHHLINSNLANSCVVIDEADFYDNFTLANIIFLLKVLHYWKVPVLIMSASLPESALPLYRKSGFEINGILEDKNSPNYKKCFDLKLVLRYDSVDGLIPLIDKCIDRENGIIYSNTVDEAIKVYNKVLECVKDKGVDIPVILYHSRFTEPHKLQKEEALLRALGKEAWSSGTARGIAVLTQIGEISINISAEIMISDLCPIDRLMQRAGRLCRFDNKVGELYITIPYKNDDLYPAPYGSFLQKEKSWKPCASLMATRQLLKPGKYTAKYLVTLLNQVYENGIAFDAKSESNANVLENMFTINWLINPAEKWQEDDTHSNQWQSRDIAPQDIAFVCMPERAHFNNYSQYMEYVLMDSVSLPVYLLDKGRKMHRIDCDCEITIGNEPPVKINIIREGYYDFDKGVDLTSEPNDNFL